MNLRLPGFADHHPDEIVVLAKTEHAPIRASYCLLSGGGDSTVLAHRTRFHYETLLHIDTGTACPGVRDFVREFADWLGKPLEIIEAGDAYRRLVLGGEPLRNGGVTPALGCPVPWTHSYAYRRIKERTLEAFLGSVQRERGERVVLLAGTRRLESGRRMRTQSNLYRRRGSQVWVNPLIDWSDEQMRVYRAEYGIPQSDVSALLHRSGECNCGSFAHPGEREMLQSLWPDWFEQTIGCLEREAQARGLAICRWGEQPASMAIIDGVAAEMCSDCQLRLELDDYKKGMSDDEYDAWAASWRGHVA